LQRLLNQVAERGYRKSTLKHICTYLRAALEYAVDEDFINRNPAWKLELPKVQKSRERFYSFIEMNRLLSVAAGSARMGRKISPAARPQSVSIPGPYGHGLPRRQLPEACLKTSRENRRDWRF
jgi:hypothetical protein